MKKFLFVFVILLSPMLVQAGGTCSGYYVKSVGANSQYGFYFMLVSPTAIGEGEFYVDRVANPEIVSLAKLAFSMRKPISFTFASSEVNSCNNSQIGDSGAGDMYVVSIDMDY